MKTGGRVAGIELSPTFVAATESKAFSICSADYIERVPLHQLVEGVQPSIRSTSCTLITRARAWALKLTRLT